MWLLPCKEPFNFLVCTFFTQTNLAQPCSTLQAPEHIRILQFIWGLVEKNPTSYMYEVFTCYKLLSVASNITHPLLFVYHPLPCIRLPLHVTAKTRRTKILAKFTKLCGDGPNYPQHTRHPYSLPACPYAQRWTFVIPDRSFSWELLEFIN